jgi:hypothetical protein
MGFWNHLMYSKDFEYEERIIIKSLWFWSSCVVGTTSGVCQGQRYLPAGVPGISTALSQEDRLCPKGRLRQQPAGDSTEESQSRQRRQDLSNGRFAKSGLAPTRSTEAKDGHDASHVQTPPTSEQEPSPQKDPRQKGEDMPPRCRSKEEKALYKVATVRQGVRGQRITPMTQPRRSRQPGSRPPNL